MGCDKYQNNRNRPIVFGCTLVVGIMPTALHDPEGMLDVAVVLDGLGHLFNSYTADLRNVIPPLSLIS